MNAPASQVPVVRVLLSVLGAVLAPFRRNLAPEPEAPPAPFRGPAHDPWGRASSAWLDEVNHAAQAERGGWLGELRTAAGDEPDEPAPVARPRPTRRVGVTVALVALFALGAALTAAAGDQFAGAVVDDASPAAVETTVAGAAEETASTEATAETTTAETATSEETTTDAPTTTPDPAVTTDPAPAAEDDALARHPQAPAVQPAPVAAPTPAPDKPAAHPTVARKVVRGPAKKAAPTLVAPIPASHVVNRLDVESSQASSATVWLHRTLPDPTPESHRLTPAFAKELQTTARRDHVDWALLLGILRARGDVGAVPASQSGLSSLARALATADRGSAPVLAVTGDTATAEQAVAIAHLNRAVGIGALVHGLEWAKEPLGKRLLDDRRVTIYAGGRADIEAGRVDVRVLALVAFLADTYGSVDVSCLISGHRLYARPGVVSAHIYGLAADISAVGHTSILGNQEPGGITEEVVRSILLLPVELRPRQVISLLGLGGPSFAQADHYTHIHVGF
ncbi:MAG TPA: hypothetical protein VFU10_05255 [Gaiellaceae bacterium]|nr:hypothetical protein [Gaiellaceae bacterium]